MGYKEFWSNAHPAYSHFKSDMPTWHDYGERVVDLFSDFWSPAIRGKEPAPRRILEWGCGGGAISHELLRSWVNEVIGVDISQASLDEASLQMRCGLPSNCRFTPKLIGEPEDLIDDDDISEAEIDGIVSVAVFQHFPSKDYTRRVLSVMRKILKAGGVALIQVRFDNGNPKYRSKDPSEPYDSPNMFTRCSWGIEVFWRELKLAGFGKVLVADIQESDNYAWYICR